MNEKTEIVLWGSSRLKCTMFKDTVGNTIKDYDFSNCSNHNIHGVYIIAFSQCFKGKCNKTSLVLVNGIKLRYKITSL